jgi:hypothetical protein
LSIAVTRESPCLAPERLSSCTVVARYIFFRLDQENGFRLNFRHGVIPMIGDVFCLHAVVKLDRPKR